MSLSLPEWVFDNFLFRPWPGRWLANAAWSQFTTSLSMGLSLGASGLFMLEQRARRLGLRTSARLERALCVGLSTLAFLAYFDFFNPNTRYYPYYHRHELFHYYLGSKYFTELGYKRLYLCGAVAQAELFGRAPLQKRSIRELDQGNLIVPMPQTAVFSDPARCKRNFAEPRWSAFKADIAWFAQSSPGVYGETMFTDHGYNPPPVWTMTGKLLSSLAPAGDHFFKLLALIDVLLQLGALLMIRWAFGLRVMAIAAVFWGCNAPADFRWTGGAFLRQDWYFLFVAALCFARKRYFALSGGALAWSALLRIFPIVFFVGPGLIVLFDVLRKRRLRPDYARFILGSALSFALLFTLSGLVSGFDAYPAFFKHISGHKGTPLTNNMGLEMLAAHNWDAKMVFMIDERLADHMQGWKEAYTARVTALSPLLTAVTALVLGWMAWALRRTKLLWVGMALSLPLLMSVLNLTCYYYAMFVAPAALVLLCPAIAPAYLALAAASQSLLISFYWIDDEYAALSLLFYAFSLSTLYALSRPPSLRRLRARWAGRPEPQRTAAR